MEGALKAIFAASFFGMLAAFPYYFFQLSDFARMFKERHPGEWEKQSIDASRAELSVAYEIAMAIKDRKWRGQEIALEVIEQRRRVVRGLYVGMLLFMAALFSFLGLTLIQGKVH